MLDTIHVLNIPITNINKKKATKIILTWLNQDKTKIIFTPNPEMIMVAQKDKSLRRAIKFADMVVPDGIGVVWASKYSEATLSERVAGYDLVQTLFEELSNTDKTVYFLGAAPNIANKAADNMKKKYKGLKIIGTHHGYFKSEEESIIISEIQNLKPDLLLVGLGVPKGEKWLYENKTKFNSKVCISVGGSFDGMAGNVKRAPIIFQKYGLEWFYRLIRQPARIKRMIQLPIFVVKVIKKSLQKR